MGCARPQAMPWLWLTVSATRGWHLSVLRAVSGAETNINVALGRNANLLGLVAVMDAIVANLWRRRDWISRK